jgi:hypothetical protein
MPCEHGCQRGHGQHCHAIRVRHPRFCELIAQGRADYAELVDRLTLDPPDLITPVFGPTLLSDEQYDRQRNAELCRFKVQGEGCCDPTRCGPGGEFPGRVVGINDCLSCPRALA